MRRYVLMVFFPLLSLMGINAQIHFKLGPCVGMNSTVLNTNGNIPYAQQTVGSGIAAGLFARLEMGRWYIQPEYMYVSESSSLTGVNPSSTASDINFKVSGYNADCLVGYKLFKSGELSNARAFAGLGQLFNNNSNLNFEGITLPQVNLINGSTNVIAGIGTDVLRFTVDIRYIRSLTELYTSNYSIESNVFLLSLGIKFF
jgi:hypothetical protein